MTSAVNSKQRRTGVLAKLLRHRSGAVGLFITLFFLVLAVVGPWVTPYDPAAPDYMNLSASFSLEHPLGTDPFGRDTLSRLLAGARYSILIGVSATVLGAVVGSLWGLWAGYAGGLTDTLSMRLVDILLAFPGLLIAIGLITLTGAGVWPVIFASSLFGVPVFARLARGATLSIKERAYIEAAQGLGAKGPRIMFRHVLPGMIAPVLVYATLRSGVTLLIASGLSFLGLGVQPPTPEWGAMLSAAQLYLTVQPLLAFAPGVTITLAVLGFNLLGDGLRDVLDPTLRV